MKMALTQLVERRTVEHINRALDASRIPEEAVKDVCDWLIQTGQWRDLSRVSAMLDSFIEAREQLHIEESSVAPACFQEPEYIVSEGSDYVIRIASEPELQDRLLRWHASFSVIGNVVFSGEQRFGFVVLSAENGEAHFAFQVPGFAEIIVRPHKNEWIWRGDGAFADVIFAIKSFLDVVGAPA